jgi:hypothetical protein
MLNSGGVVTGQFEHPLNDYKGFAVSRVLHDFYELDPQKVGFYGGGGLDARFDFTPITFVFRGLPPDMPRWGKVFKAALAQDFNRTMEIFCHGTSLPLENNSFSLDPDLKDAWGLPALRLTYKDHPDDIKLGNWMFARAHEIFEAAGAKKSGASLRGNSSSPCTFSAPAAWEMIRKVPSSIAITALMTSKTFSSAMEAAW